MLETGSKAALTRLLRISLNSSHLKKQEVQNEILSAMGSLWTRQQGKLLTVFLSAAGVAITYKHLETELSGSVLGVAETLNHPWASAAASCSFS